MATNGVKRKLAAILSADVKGYSRLMGEDEEATVRTLTAYREVMASLIQQFRGRVVDSPGDNVLAEFASVVDAVQCAVEIQRVLKAKNAELPENRRMEFRIGVNLGDVIEEGERIYGDGVNIAARLEGLAEGGGICLSGSAYEQIENKLPLHYEYLGEHTVKNIRKPIRVYRALTEAQAARAVSRAKGLGLKPWQWAALGLVAVLVVGAGALAIWNLLLRPTSPPVEVASVEKMAFPLPKEPSIAVMPFDNLSGDPEQEYIADGISENIMATLSKIPEMFVIARNSTFAYKGKHVKVQQVAEDLGVRYVLEGSVLKSGERLRITAQLIDAITGHHLWTEQYEREMKELFGLLDEITQEIAVALQVKLTHGEQMRMWAKGTDSLEAWRHVSKGISLFWRWRKEDNAKARELFEQAVELDPEYAAAWTWLAGSHYLDVALGWADSPSESYRRALQLTQKALELDDSNPLAHALLGEFHGHKGQYGKAIAEGEKAIALGPNNALVHWTLADTMQEAGKPEEAILLSKKAMRLHPHYPAIYLFTLAVAYHQAGRYEEAFATWKELLERSRKGEYKVHDALSGLTLTCTELGREDEARTYAEELFKIKPNLSLTGLASALKLYKTRSQLERIWSALRKAGIVPPLLSSAVEFTYKGPPAFTLMHPEGRTEREFLSPEKVFKVDTYEGLIEFHVFVADIPKDVKLADVGPKVFAPALEKDVGAEVEVLSNEEIELADGAKAYKTEMEWTHRRGHFVMLLLVSAFKENKWVYVAAVTVGDPDEIGHLAQSLRFMPYDIPLTAAVHHVHEPGDISYTYIDVVIGENFTGSLPDDIDMIVVTGPKGDLPISKEDFLWLPQFRSFWIGMLGAPEIGAYTFTVTSGNVSGTATDTQSVLRTLPIPDTNTFSPSKGETLSSKTPTFSWGAVDADVPVYYRLEIKTPWGDWVYRTDRLEGMLSHTVPADKLAAGQTYIWRVRVVDNSDGIKVQNRSNSEWLNFTMAKSLQ